MNENVICNNCFWTGSDTELLSATADADDMTYNRCPECLSDEIEDLEEEE